MSESNESCSCQEILDLWGRRGHTVAHEFTSADPRECDAISVRYHVRRILFEKFGKVPIRDGSHRKTIVVKLGCKRFL